MKQTKEVIDRSQELSAAVVWCFP